MRVWRRKNKGVLIVELTEREEMTLRLKRTGSNLSKLRLGYLLSTERGNALWVGREKFQPPRRRLAWLAKEVAESYEGYKPIWLEELLA